VEIALKDLEYWNRGDMDAFVRLWDDDVVLRAAEGWPERVFRGKDAVRSFYESFAETVGRDSVIEDLIDAGDVVVTRMRAHMTGVQSGLEGDAVHPGHDVQKGQGRAGRVLLGSPGSPRSRRAVGVGDVGRELGAGPSRLRHVQPARSRRLPRAHRP
jgi:hypothetical protein